MKHVQVHAGVHVGVPVRHVTVLHVEHVTVHAVHAVHALQPQHVVPNQRALQQYA